MFPFKAGPGGEKVTHKISFCVLGGEIHVGEHKSAGTLVWRNLIKCQIVRLGVVFNMKTLFSSSCLTNPEKCSLKDDIEEQTGNCTGKKVKRQKVVVRKVQ